MLTNGSSLRINNLIWKVNLLLGLLSQVSVEKTLKVSPNDFPIFAINIIFYFRSRAATPHQETALILLNILLVSLF